MQGHCDDAIGSEAQATGKVVAPKPVCAVVAALESQGRGAGGDVYKRQRIAGLPGRIAIAALGLAIAGLSLTGVYIWWRKRRARHWNGR